MAYNTGSYVDSWEGVYTGSCYRTRYIEIDSNVNDDDEDGQEMEWVPGILYDSDNNRYWTDMLDTFVWSAVPDSYDTGSRIGDIWCYDLTDSQKNDITNDAQYIATLVSSSL